MKITLVITALMLGNILHSQDTVTGAKSYFSIYLQHNYSKFKYRDSNNEKDSNLSAQGFTGVGLDYALSVNNKIIVRGGINY